MQQRMIPSDILNFAKRGIETLNQNDIELKEKYNIAKQILVYSDDENYYRSVVFSEALELSIQYVFLYSKLQNVLTNFMIDSNQFYQNMFNVFLRASQHQNGSHVVQTSLVILSYMSRVINERKNQQQMQQFDDKMYQQYLKLIEDNIQQFYDTFSVQILSAIYQCELGIYTDTNAHFLLRNHVYCNTTQYQKIKSKYFDEINKCVINDINNSSFEDFILLCNSKFTTVFIKENIEMYKQQISSHEEQQLITNYKENQNYQYFIDTIIQIKDLQNLSDKLFVILIKLQIQELQERPIIYLYQNVITNINFNLFQQHIQMLEKNFEDFLSIEYYNKVIQNTISSIRSYNKLINQDNESLIQSFKQKIISSAKNETYFVYNYLFPNKDTNQILNLDFQFNKNENYAIKYLNQYKKDISKEELDQLKELKKQEHIKIEEAEKKEQLRQRGKTIHYNFNENGIWNVGKEIIISMIQSKQYSTYAVVSFAKSFLQQGSSIQRNNIMQLLQHPAGLELIQNIVDNTFVPVQYKIMLYYQVKPQNNEDNMLTETKFGRMVLLWLAKSIKQQLSMDQQYGSEKLIKLDYKINITILAEMCKFIQQKYSYLRRLQETKILLDILDYNTFITKNDLWSQTLIKHYVAAEKKIAKKSIKK